MTSTGPYAAIAPLPHGDASLKTRLSTLIDTVVSADAMAWIALALLWVLMHPFGGIDGDSRIYMGRALADIDPDGVGRDLMFVMDGQSGYTIFRQIAKALAGSIGLGDTVVVLSVANIVAWFAAVVVLVRTIVPGRAAVLVLAAVIVLPRLYTPWNLLSAGESIAEPRPLAEACVLLALAALIHGRLWLCVAALGVAALFHPIMAAPGVGVLFIVLARRDRRWLIGAAALGGAVLGAAWLGLPLASRLAATMDGPWRAVLIDRNPYLFVTRWPLDALAPMFVRAVTIGFACLWFGARTRTIVLAACGVAGLGLAASAVLGDGVFDVLVVQAQLWRALWLPTVLSSIAAGLCLCHLPRQGARGQIALCLLALAWIELDTMPTGPLAAAFAIVVYLGVPRLPVPISRAYVLAIGACCGIVAGATLWTSASAVGVIAAAVPPGIPATWSAICTLRLLVVPALALAYAWWWQPDGLAARTGSLLVVVAGVILLATQWYERPDAQADVDAATLKPDLVALLAQRPGDILWTEGDEAWAWLHQANWNGHVQGSSIVFSRDLALQWQQRAVAVVRAGLNTAHLLRPLTVPTPVRPVALDANGIEAFCAAPGHPAWIVAPLAADAALPEGLGITTWTPPHPRGRPVTDGETLHWLSLDRYAVIPCGAPTSVRKEG